MLVVLVAAACVGQPDSDPSGSPDASLSTPDADPAAPDAGPDDPDAASGGDPDAGETPTLCVRGTGGAGLNLRDAPDAGATVLAVLPEGAEVDVVGAPSGAWQNVAFAGDTGWAHGDWLLDCPDPGDGTGAGFNFLLPWTAGVAYRVSQGHNTGSHTGNGSWAWDLALPEGTPLLAAHGGTVRRVRYDSTYGACDSSAADAANYVVIDRGDGVESLYLHMQHIPAGAEPLAVGQVIDRGTFIGYSGNTGWSCGAHLHYQVQQSPSNGGTSSWYNPSVHEYFWDTGEPYDPPPGAEPVSQNGVADVPAPAPTAPPSADTGDVFHGHAGTAWDEAMRGAAAATALPPNG